MKRLTFYLYLILITLNSLILDSCSKQSDTSPPDAGLAGDTSSSEGITVHFSREQYRLAGIRTGHIEKRTLSHLIKVNGIVDVEPSGTATVSAPLGGYVQTPGRLPGERVTKGQVLARIENPEFITLQQEYYEGRARLEYLEQEYDRQRSLRDEDINAEKTFQQVTSDYKITQATVDGLLQKLAIAGISKSTLEQGTIVRSGMLYAPITGFIKSSNVSIGRYVNPTDVLFELVNEDELHLSLNAFQADAQRLQVGQTVKFSLASEDDFSRTAKVFLVAKATEAGNVIPVHCHIEKKDMSGLLSGMYIKAWIETTNDEQNTVPSDAIVQMEGRDYLVVQSDTTNGYSFRLIAVGRGLEQGALTAVELPGSFDTQGTKIVTVNAYVILSAIRNAGEQEE